ncbi:MAG: hypothetical protein WCR96_01590 [Candidatus Methanomethylophilaceae archaeon]
METIEEVLGKADVVREVKARRVLNVSDKDSGITLEEIEKKGVTIERLLGLDVPVFTYGGQVTIHGRFNDDISSDLRVAGYKSVFKNGNGSLGVRYVAVDGEKKRRLEDICSLGGWWRITIDSKGCQAYRSFNDKQACLDCYNSAPTDYIGTKYAFRSVYGRFYVVSEIGAIYEKDFWRLAESLSGLNEDGYKKACEAREDKREDDRLRYEEENKNRLAKEAELLARRDEIKSGLNKNLESAGYKKVAFSGPGTYVYAFASKFCSDKIGYNVVEVKKGGFGRTLERHVLVKDIADIRKAVFDGKVKVIDDRNMEVMKKKVVFKV